MNKIYIVGLGPGSMDSLTLGAVNRINSDKPHFLRTLKHPSVQYFNDNNIMFTSFDDIYDTKDSFDEVYNTIVLELIEAVKKHGEINYYVPGNPMVAEKTVQLLIESFNEEEIEIVSGISFIEPILEVMNKDPIEGLKVLDGIDIKASDVDINSHLIITQVYNSSVMSDAKLVLMEIYPDEYKVSLIHNAGISGAEMVENLFLYEIDHSKNIGSLTSLFIPKVEKEKYPIYDYNDITNIMKQLRSEGGCPWDREQDHLSIRAAILEEAYELVEALNGEDIDHIVEELGDLLLQVVFQAQIALDEGEFNPILVTTSLANKLITRHPHVFFQKNVDNSAEVVYNWDEIKYQSRNISLLSEKLRNIPRLPALMRSYKVQEKAAQIGFDWEDIKGSSDKIIEEHNEVLEAYNLNGKGDFELEGEIGDLLFAVVNLSRFLEINPEVALERTTGKFIKRLETMEYKAKEMGIILKELNLEQLDNLWDLAKEDELSK
ncbi:MAG: nucleoside triphosphate pyrophosphohydrolase [Gudongella sp.]|nr:nucleoside triphosphate pyrophosphohydrolase [Gudongella sp.]